MSRFRKIRRAIYDDRSRAQAHHRGAHQTLAAGGYAGAGTWHAVPTSAGLSANLGNTYGINPVQQHWLNAQAVNHQLVQLQRAQFAYQQLMLQSKVGLQHYSDPLDRPPLAREIRAGEIIAYRAWIVRLINGQVLYEAMHTDALWLNGEMSACQLGGQSVSDYGLAGVHAWKTLEQARAYIGTPNLYTTVVVGEVELWGEVVEHDLGYRAEFGKIRRILEIQRPLKRPAGHEFYIDADGMIAQRATNPAFGDLCERTLDIVAAFVAALMVPHVITALFY